ncbi:MAG TPA: phytanoyl-CoA dioxygenase, partial [Blastocatellia bacterium]|nr:phytanoyl-CoA dioxygenase [Blastocatellia bacterium]
MPEGRYSRGEIDGFTEEVLRDGFCVLPGHFPKAVLDRWREAFTPLLEDHIAREGELQNRGPGRYYVTLPFAEPFADPRIFEDEDVLAISQNL